MEAKELFKQIQKLLTDVPLLLIGSGSSAACGIPGMAELGQHLIKELSKIYAEDASWNMFRQNIVDGFDLETALSNVVLQDEIIKDIRKVTWEFISKADIQLFYRLVFNQEQLPLVTLLRKLYCQRRNVFDPKSRSELTHNRRSF